LAAVRLMLQYDVTIAEIVILSPCLYTFQIALLTKQGGLSGNALTCS
jgi:hypothetical protein